MKLKQILKKALKYVVTPLALVGSIIGLYSINSYAYSTNQLSYTFTTSTYNNTTYYTYQNSYDNSDNYVLLVNYRALVNGNYSVRLNYYDNSYNVVNYEQNNWYFRNNLIMTRVYQFINNENFVNSSYISFYSAFASNFEILNIDLVKGSDLTLTQYTSTYIDNLENQLSDLQSDYDTLNNNYNTLENNYDTLQNNYNTLEDNYNTLEDNYEQKQNEYDMLTNGQLGYLDYMEFYINNQSIEFGNDSETELNLNELIDYNLYSNNSLNLSYFTTQQVNPNYLPLKIVSYYDKLPVNLLSMYFNGGTTGIIKFGYYYNSQFLMKQISFDNTGTAIDTINTSLINYEVFNGISVEYIEYIEIQFNNADAIAGSINFNSNYNIAYSTGYTNGYNYGYNVNEGINRDKIDNARQEGYQNGYDTGNIEGYNRGYNEGSTQDISTNGFKTLITTILSYPVNMVKESLNFEFMGIHVASIVLFIVSLGIVAFVIKRFKD